MTQHRMILASADLKTIHAVVIATRKAPFAQREEHVTCNRKTGVRDANGAPQESEAA